MSADSDGLARELEHAVRNGLRAAFLEEFEVLGQAGHRAAEALHGVRRVASLRLALWAVFVLIFCSVIPLAVVWMEIPTHGELMRLRTEREALEAQVRQLSQRGGRIDLRRCGEVGRLCARVERSAPRYGADGDFYVLKGY